jgi:hypothetical protein
VNVFAAIAPYTANTNKSEREAQFQATDIDQKGGEMNTVDFVIGQLLSFEMMALSRRHTNRRLALFLSKEQIMENQFLVILLLVVGLIANFTVMASSEK